MSGSRRPTSAFAYNDITAVDVLKELNDQGIAVPKQISLAGFDNISLSMFTTPP
jgi:LacI family transcriptional regulator